MKIAAIASSAAIFLGLAAGAAFADSAKAGNWLNIGELNNRLEAQGYTVLEVERDDGRYEVELLGQDGVRYEAKVDRTSGEILSRERDD
ncbi:PepSY domain-containing protein [Aquamicrobium zhengzhouense]|uniref:PepSY domain-containing protein n=1 Tax=Aquamicrobium zhengzhouense TaxID=2781738 RepID=A0ABS0SEI3_9HYPH|nr:PepSY domain-containing protein [Aquamicrobium zhengzhouense]MBI1621204.1 PepSY domain-containing protein [Aquamicrobium zhengzhouense]